MAYGTNAPFGLQARTTLNSGTYNGQTQPFGIASNYAYNLFTGDPVIFQANGTIGIAGTAAVAVGANPPLPPQGPILGVFQGVKYRDTQGNYKTAPYWAAGTATFLNEPATALICTDASVLYDVQVSTSAAYNAATFPVMASLAPDMIGANANLNIGGLFIPPANTGIPVNPPTGNTVSGQSAYYLDISTVSPPGGAGNTFNVKIISITPVPGNQFTTTDPVTGTQVPMAFNNAIVMINNDVLKGGTGTAGI